MGQTMSERRLAVTVRPRAAAPDVVDIDVYEEIGVDWWTGEGVTAKQIRDALKGTKPKTINLSVNSGGGDAFEGVAIYNVLRQYAEKGAHIVGDVTGLAASAASIVLAAADEVRIPSNAAIMIHEAWSGARGTAADFEKRAALLRQINGTAADTYLRGTMRRGVAKTRDDLLALMAEETWMFGSEAVDHGFADEVTDPLEAAASVDLSTFRHAQLARERLPRAQRAAEKPMSEPEFVGVETDPVAADAQADTQAALDLAQQSDAKLAAAEARIAELEAERDLVRASAAEREADAARMAAELNRREVQECVTGGRIYPAELDAMVELRAKDRALFDRLLAARPPIALTQNITGGDTAENTVTADPDAKFAALVREAGKDD